MEMQRTEEKRERVFRTELAYVLGILALALGTALMERAEMGMSMVVAPAYLIHLKVSQWLPFFSFGMAEYCLQGGLLAVLFLVVRPGRPAWFFSFVTAVLYGLCLDGAIRLAAGLPSEGLPVRCVLFGVGLCCCAFGVALMFHTYLAPEVYELFVKEVAARYRFSLSRCKTVYDCISCGAAILLSFAFFGWGRFEGVKLGTIVTALLNGWLIGRFSLLLERCFSFRDWLPFRKYFED